MNYLDTGFYCSFDHLCFVQCLSLSVIYSRSLIQVRRFEEKTKDISWFMNELLINFIVTIKKFMFMKIFTQNSHLQRVVK